METLDNDILRIASVISEDSDIEIHVKTLDGVVTLCVSQDQPAYKTLRSKFAKSPLQTFSIQFGGTPVEDDGGTFIDHGVQNNAHISLQLEEIGENPDTFDSYAGVHPSLHHLKASTDACGMYDVTGDGIFLASDNERHFPRLPTMVPSPP